MAVPLSVTSVVPLDVAAGVFTATFARLEAADAEEGNEEWFTAFGGKGTLRTPFLHES